MALYSWYGEPVIKQLPIYTFSRHKATLTFIWSQILDYMTNVSLFPFSSVFGLPQILRETSGFLAAKCSTTFTSWSLTLSVCCLVLGRLHIMRSSKDILLKTAACCGWKWGWWEWWECPETVKLWAVKTKTISWKKLKWSTELRGTAVSYDYSLWVPHYKQV